MNTKWKKAKATNNTKQPCALVAGRVPSEYGCCLLACDQSQHDDAKRPAESQTPAWRCQEKAQHIIYRRNKNASNISTSNVSTWPIGQDQHNDEDTFGVRVVVRDNVDTIRVSFAGVIGYGHNETVEVVPISMSSSHEEENISPRKVTSKKSVCVINRNISIRASSNKHNRSRRCMPIASGSFEQLDRSETI